MLLGVGGARGCFLELLHVRWRQLGPVTPRNIKRAREKGLFVANDCLEPVDCFKCGRHNSMTRVLSQLGLSKAARERATIWKRAPEELDADQFVKDIEAIGKGRFAEACNSNG